MFLGHYAVGFAGKKAAPKTSLGTLFLAAQFLDLLWPVLLLLRIEHVRVAPGITAFSPFDFYDYPISHGLLTSLFWSAAFGLLYYWRRRYTRGAWMLAGAVFSHWVLDFLTHRPDLPIAPGVNIYLGLSLWNSVAATVVVEAGLFIAALVIYMRTTKATDRTGRFALWGLIGFLVLAYVTSSTSPPPPETTPVAIGGFAQWLLILWAYWIDRHRTVRQ